MDPKALLAILHTAEKLKDTTRHCYTTGGRHESVAEHSWRCALTAYFLKDQFPDVDMEKVITMCLIHDLGEAFTGDIPSFYKTTKDEENEDMLLQKWVDTLPYPYRDEMTQLYEEMAQRTTAEARIFKAIDSMEAVIQHNESSLDTWIPKEFSLNLTYGEDKVAFDPYLVNLRQALREETEEKLRTEGKITR